jgi:putative nucleotidyltransferase with HDIG domain
VAPRRRSEIYRLAVGLLAVAVFSSWGVGAGAAGTWPAWWLVAALAVAGLLALRFPLHISVSVKVSLAAAVAFATILLLPAWQAAALAGATLGVNVVLAALRRVRMTGEKPPLGTIGLALLFNAGQAYFSVLGAGLLMSAAGVTAYTQLTPARVLVIVAAAVTMYMTNVLLVSIAVSLATSRSLLSVLRNTHKLILGQFASLYLVGAAAAFAAAALPWLLVLTTVAVFLVYRSWRHRIELRHESVLAMERMADEVDRRDPYTYQHSQRVARYSRVIATELRLSSAEIELIELAAKVHDIGKIRIPDSILLKAGKLTDEERRVMETHPRLGFQILRPFSEYAKVLDLVLTHHERYDGLGYPNGTVGRRQLMIAQVIPVADSFDAMTSNRAYRPAKSWVGAMEELRRGAGSQWNPKVVEAALAALRREETAAVSLAAVPAVAAVA